VRNTGTLNFAAINTKGEISFDAASAAASIWIRSTAAPEQRFNGGPCDRVRRHLHEHFVDPVRNPRRPLRAPRRGRIFCANAPESVEHYRFPSGCRLDSNPSLMPTPMGWSPAGNKAANS